MAHYKPTSVTTATGTPSQPADQYANRTQPGLVHPLLQEIRSPSQAVQDYAVSATGTPSQPADQYANRTQPGLVHPLLQEIREPSQAVQDYAVSEYGIRTAFEDLKKKIYINAINLSGHYVDNTNPLSGIIGNIESTDIRKFVFLHQ